MSDASLDLDAIERDLNEVEGAMEHLDDASDLADEMPANGN